MLTKFSTGLVSGLLLFGAYSCKEQIKPTDFAKKWTTDIKKKILEDASAIADSTKNDSVHHEVTTFKNGKKLKQIFLAQRENQSELEAIKYDTGMIVYYSSDQNFQFVQQPCIPGAERSYEGVAYKGDRYGMAEYIYCKKDLREIIFHYDNLNVGSLTKYKKDGTLQEELKLGNDEKLEKLRDLKFYR